MKTADEPHRKTVTSRKAFTLVEISIVLGLIGLMTGIVWITVKTTWHDRQKLQLNQQIMTVVKNVRDAYGPSGKRHPSPTGQTIDMTTGAYNDGLLPQEMRTATGAFKHALDGQFQLEARNVPAGTTQMGNVRIWLRGLKRDDCARLLTEFPVLAPELRVRRIGTTVNNKAINADTDPSTTAVTNTQASAWCGAVANNAYIDFSVR